MARVAFSFVWLLVFFLSWNFAQSRRPSKFIFQKLNNIAGRQLLNQVIPQTNSSTPVKVDVTLTLINIRHADPATNEVEIEAWLYLTWNSSVTFDPDDYNQLDSVRVPVYRMWTPDITAYNGNIEFLFNNHRRQEAILYYNGQVTWVPKTKIRVTCDVEAGANSTTTGANNSTTTCNLRVGSWSYSSSRLKLGDQPTLDMGSYLAESRYLPTNSSAVMDSKEYPCCPDKYEDITFSFSFHKK